ncbi:MAG: hypothetical protein WCH99_13810 [Verrucomicrobiota bacterium]
MPKKASVQRTQPQPLAAGQVWRMAEADLLVTSVGKLMVNYKLGKSGSARVRTSINGIKAIEKYLKANRAVLV